MSSRDVKNNEMYTVNTNIDFTKFLCEIWWLSGYNDLNSLKNCQHQCGFDSQYSWMKIKVNLQ